MREIMFNYSEKTKVDIKFKMLDLFKTIKADKNVKADASNVVSVILSNTLSPCLLYTSDAADEL